jgi:hypothetical protein
VFSHVPGAARDCLKAGEAILGNIGSPLVFPEGGDRLRRNQGGLMKRVLGIATLAVLLVLMALPALATGSHGKPSVSIGFVCDDVGTSLLVVTNTSQVEARIFAFPTDQFEVEEQLLAPGGTYAVSGTGGYEVYLFVKHWKLIETGTFPVCETTTTTTEPVGPPESIQVCRDGELIFIDPSDRLETDTDECEIVTTTTTPETTTTEAPAVTQPTPATTVPAKVAVTTPAELPFTGIEASHWWLIASAILLSGFAVLGFVAIRTGMLVSVLEEEEDAGLDS